MQILNITKLDKKSAFAVGVLLLIAVLTWVIYSSLPIVGDAWAPRIFGKERGGKFSYVVRGYLNGFTGGNPRIGQFWLIFYGYFPRLHALLFSVAIPALLWMLGAHIVGSNLKTKFTQTVMAGLIVLAVFWYIDREIGATFFYQATSGNYLFALLLLLGFLLPYRLAIEHANSVPETEQFKMRRLVVVAWMLVAFLAGLGHETYGPTVIVGLAIVFGVAPLFNVKRKLWMVSGWVSFLLGYTLLVMAPGQDKRYSDNRLDGFFVETDILVGRAIDLVMLFAGTSLFILLIAAFIGAIRVYKKWLPTYQAIIFLGYLGLGLGMTLTGIAAPDGIIGERFVFAGHACLAIAVVGVAFSGVKNFYVVLTAAIFSTGYLAHEYVQTKEAYKLYNEQFDAQANAIKTALSKNETEALVPAYSLPIYNLKKYVFQEFPQVGPNPRVNSFIARYYGIEKITVLPSDETKAFGQKMIDAPLRLRFVDCPKDDGKSWKGNTDPLGGLVCEKDYLAYYDSGNSEWVVSGFTEIPSRSGEIQFAVKRQSWEGPDSGVIPIWGGIHYFNPDGAVTSPQGALKAWLTEPVITNDVKNGPIKFRLDDCGAPDGNTWKGTSDPFGVLICGETYDLTWNDSSLTWKISGLQERIGETPIKTSREIKGHSPNDGRINLLGGLYTYNENRELLDNSGKRVGEFLLLQKTGEEK